jgi:hypothetical protein
MSNYASIPIGRLNVESGIAAGLSRRCGCEYPLEPSLMYYDNDIHLFLFE